MSADLGRSDLAVDLTEAPSEISSLVSAITELNVTLVVASYDSANNQLLTAQSRVGRIDILVDRGQWLVSLAPNGSRESFDMAAWEACRTGADVALTENTLQEQTLWLEQLLRSDIVHAADVECLRRARKTRAYGRLHLPLS